MKWVFKKILMCIWCVSLLIMLQELGLYALTNILRGSVRIEKNPLLCFVDTVNWELIAKTGQHSIAVRIQDVFLTYGWNCNPLQIVGLCWHDYWLHRQPKGGAQGHTYAPAYFGAGVSDLWNTSNSQNLLWYLSDWIPFISQKVVLWVSAMWSGSNIADNYGGVLFTELRWWGVTGFLRHQRGVLSHCSPFLLAPTHSCMCCALPVVLSDRLLPHCIFHLTCLFSPPPPQPTT
jgi:hypothetical protein